MSVNIDWIALKWANINKFEPQNETDMLYSVDKQDTIGEAIQD